MRQESRVTRLDRHYLRASGDVVLDDVVWIKTAQPRPTAIGFSVRVGTGRTIGAGTMSVPTRYVPSVSMIVLGTDAGGGAVTTTVLVDLHCGRHRRCRLV